MKSFLSVLKHAKIAATLYPGLPVVSTETSGAEHFLPAGFLLLFFYLFE